ncbi:MAG: hypothetical protein J7K00_00565 [Candidatus Diapherotrites archaeon]|nr:hypothetical protein [Candidatus Diapherotrites archaeon]
MERVSTGIKGLDEIIGGGFLKGSTTFLTGPSGSGKSIWSMQFLTMAALESDESGIYIPFDETTRNITQSSCNFDWKINDLAERNKVVIYRLKPVDLHNFDPDKIENNLLNRLASVIKKIDATRLVLDSMLPIMLRMQDEPHKFYAILQYITDATKEVNVTNMLLAPQMGCSLCETALKVAADNIIELSFEPKGNSFVRCFSIKKMKGLDHPLGKQCFSIGKKGITVDPGKKFI